MINNNDLKKEFIKEALGTRKYLSYRMDLMLYKLIISTGVFLVVYFIYLDLVLTLLSASLIFALFTLFNKIFINKKIEKGRGLLLNKVKRDYFSSKIDEINASDFEILIHLLFRNEGYENIIKRGRSLYLAEKEGYIYCIKVFKLNEGIEVEKIDIRSLLTFMGQSNIRRGFLVTTSSLSEEAEKLLEKFKEKYTISIIDLEGLHNLAQKNKMLPEDSFYYKKLNEQIKTPPKKEISKNVLNSKKLALYLPAALFFYISSIWMPHNKLPIYISSYFIILSLINIVYYTANKYIN